MKIPFLRCRSSFVRLLFIFSLLAGREIRAQGTAYTFQGTITSKADGKPMPGASVGIPGTSFGGITQLNGEYRFTATLSPGTYTLQISSVGYQTQSQRVTLGPPTTVTTNVSLSEDALGLDEVVVTGTSGATSRKQLGNTIATVQAKDLQLSAATSIDQALAGKVSGAQITQNSGNPAGGISVRLRGPSTIVGSSDPLYIVDGVIINNDSRELIDLGGYSQNRLVDINPNDIERIEIIKGAAAAAIYGSRANNGVVQIFTKRGQEGRPTVNFSTQFRLSDIRKTLPYNQYPAVFTNTTVTDQTQTPVTRYDLQKDIFRTATGHEQYLSVSGGTPTTQYFFSGSLFANQGIVRGAEFSRASSRMRIQQTLTKWATLSIGSAYTYSSSREIPNGGLNEAYGALTGFIFSNNFINPQPDPVTGAYPSTAPTALLRRTNPLEAIARFDFRQRTSRFIGDAQLNLTPLPGLGIDFTFGVDTYSQLATGYIPPNNTTPSYNAGYSRKSEAAVLQLNNDLNIRYQASPTEWLKSTTGVGATVQYDRSFVTNITAQQLGVFGQTINNGANIVAGETRTERSFIGVFAQQTFGLFNRFFVTAAGRFDAASVYGVDNRWQFYPKLSGSYVISEESFWKGSSLATVLPDFKIRAAWGQAGNLTAIGPYDRFTNYSPVTVGGLVGYLAPAQLGNFSVKPERQTELEIGTDFSLAKNRIGVEFTYYNKQVKDLILNRTLSPSTGYNNRFVNIGTMTNRGFEVLVRAIPLETKKVRWNITATYTHNKNVTDGVEGNGVLPFAGGFGQVAAVNGYALGAFYATFFARNPDGSLLLTPGGLPQRERGIQGPNGTYTVQRGADGQPSGTILSKVIGNPNPASIYSLINEVAVGSRWSFRMQWDAMQNFDVFNFTRRVGDRDLYGGLAGYEPELRGEVPKGTSAALFSIFENWIEDGSFIKLRELSAAYTVAPKFWGFRNVRFSVAGRNLLSIDNYSGYDPETNAAGQSNAVRGFDFVEVPIPRTLTVGINATF
ncbi:SusC/RagA family TonB-linked outer membrane protein [Larkinella insperata]|uniref:SusC/RagA family TonB-linked outer membrane protein n=1 Tax=Larkinella insperata TaxID=332158 RepID=A0ABW3Q702_9BACT|nr:SusC/RagA family TonB-linked outer membrane protein [Larkinella insperata]